MTAISQFASGFRLFTGESINAIVNVVNNLTGTGTPQAITGTTGTFSGAVSAAGITQTGAATATPTVVAAAGASQGTATAIAATANNVVITVTASTEGVKLPTAATGRRLSIWASPTVGVNVYAAAAGQKIGTATTATTAFAVAKNTATEFYAINAVNWRVQKGS